MLINKEISIKVPGTTGNVGSGFDCIGLAVDIWNSLSISFNSDKLIIKNSGVNNNAYESIKIKDNLIITGIQAVCPEFDISKIKILSENEIPFSNGLGSSAAALCTGLLIGNHLIGNKFSLEDLNEKAIKIEGHPDNVTPCIFGGLTISVFNDEKDKWIIRKIDVSSELNIMVFTPNFISNTNNSRKKLSKSVPRSAAVYNISRVALLIDSLNKKDFAFLNEATKDSLHQDTRLEGFPEMRSIMNAAIDGGALGAIVSGSGPSVMIFTKGNEFTIDYEIKEVARKHNLDGNIILTKPSNQGIILSK